MKNCIMIINPNSDTLGTKCIANAATQFANDEYNVETVTTKSGPKFIITNYDYFLCANEMLDTVMKNQDKYDAFIVACHADPNLDLLKEHSNKLVIGIAEASMKIATMLGHKFSILAPGDRGIPNKELLVDKYGLTKQLASIRSIAREDGDSILERMISAGQRAINEDNAEVLVLGCAEFAGLDKKIEKRLHVPVLDGVICALMLANGLINYSVSTSKHRRFNADYEHN